MTIEDGDYEYSFDPDADNNTAASIYRMAREGGNRILDIGSGPGIVAGHLATSDGLEVTCIDVDADSLEAAKRRGVTRTFQRDLNSDDWSEDVRGEQFDVIVLADVLEHLISPDSVLLAINEWKLLADDGFVIVSIPNAAHESIITELASGRFDYSETGLLDRTHIRFFTRQTFVELANESGYEAVETRRTTRTLEQTEFGTNSTQIPDQLRRELAQLNKESRTYQFVFKLVAGSRNAELARLRQERTDLLAELSDLTVGLRETAVELERLRGADALAEQLSERTAVLERRIGHLELELERQTVRADSRVAEIEELRTRQHSDEATISQLRSLLVEHRQAISRAGKTKQEAVAKARAARSTQKKRADRLQREIDMIHASETWKLGRMLKVALTPLVWAKRFLNSITGRGKKGPGPKAKKDAKPSKKAGKLKEYLTPSYRLDEDLEMREAYETELAQSSFSGSGRRIAFAVFTNNLDEARGDIYVAVGLGRHLRRLGWDVIYVPRWDWDEIPAESEFAVAMLPTLDPTTLPPGVRRIAWVRNEATTWASHPSLNAFEAILCSSQAARELLREHFAGPVDILPIGVDTDLFNAPEATDRSGITTTVNQWGRERQTYSALRSRPIEFPLAIFGKHLALGEELEQHRAGLVSYFSLPSLYRQVDAVIDDLNHTTKPFGNVNSRVFEALACGAAVITNSARGLNELGLDELPSYIVDQELHDLANMANQGDLRDVATRLSEVVRQKHSFAARAQSFDAYAESWGERPPAHDEIVGYFPDYTEGNPYQDLLYSALPDTTLALPVRDIFNIELMDRCQESGQDFTLHVHWTAPILSSSKSDDVAATRLNLFLAQLDRAKSLGVRLVWTLHNVMPHDGIRPELERALRQELAIRADLIHVMCEQTREEVEDLYHLPAEKVAVVPHCSYVGVYPSAMDRETARTRLGVSPDDEIFLFLGGIRPYKGVDMLLDAFGVVHSANPSTRLVIAGRPGKFEGAKELEDRCRSTPGVLANFNAVPDDQLQVFYKAADVAVFPYRRGLNSGAINLAYTFGVPVIAPGIGCVAEQLRPETSESFTPGDVLSLQTALESSGRLMNPASRRAAVAMAEQSPPASMAEAFRQLLYPPEQD